MPENDTQNTASQQQGTSPEGQHQAESGTGPVEGTPTPKDVQQRAQEPASSEGEGDVADLPEWAQRLIRQERSESASQRTARQSADTQAKQQADEKIQAILKAAGLDTADDDEDPVKAAADARQQAETDARTARVELAVYRAAAGKNADAAALLDSRSFQDRVKDLDPTDADALAAAIGDAVQANPRLAVTQAAPRSSADFTGGSGDGAITPEKFRAMGMQERNALHASDPDTYRRLAATK